jgi:choline dehydrogenase
MDRVARSAPQARTTPAGASIMVMSFDYIVVGAGTAGCIVANRLVTRARARVLLVEAGHDRSSIYLRMPAGFAFASKQPDFDWGLVSEPEPGLNGRRMPCPRGKVLGGSSAVNAMAFVRGNPKDFDGWTEIAGSDWTYETCLPYFKSIESFSGGGNVHRGGHGPFHVKAPAYSNPLYAEFLKACVQAGYAVSADTNGAVQEGFGPMDQNIHDGLRESSATAFIDPIRGDANLTVRTGARVERILFEGRLATGIEVNGPSGKESIRANAAVILCAGAVNTPHLLLLSGVGPGDQLKRHGIAVVRDLGQVGNNLQDHVDVTLRLACPLPITESLALRLDRKILIALEWLLFKTGKGTTNHFEVAGYIKTRKDAAQPNIQLCFMPLLVAYDGVERLNSRHGYQISIMLLRPRSRGAVELASADPAAAPRLRFNYLSDEDDIRQLHEGLAAARSIVSQPAMAKYTTSELAPGAEIRSEKAIEDFIRNTAKSTHHPCGTCAMGRYPDTSVVNGAGVVHGIERLRVIDSSIIPTLPGGNLNAPTMMVAEKIVQHLLGGASEH